MQPSVMHIVWLSWLWVSVAAVSLSVAAEATVHGKVGGEVVLRPPAGSVTESINLILWKKGNDKAMEWDKNYGTVDSYRQFKERGHLNTSTGEMTISGLQHNDSELYTPEINGKVLARVRLVVLSPVPVPTVRGSCGESTCELTCEGNTAGAGPVTYTWMSGSNVVHTSSVNQYTIHKENSSSSDEFSCKMENRVSHESSESFAVSFHPTPEGGPKISTGITVLVVLLTVVVLLVAFHKWKAGMWFFEKDSKPWEADFWRKSEPQARAAPASNGTPAHQHNENAEEETPMTKS